MSDKEIIELEILQEDIDKAVNAIKERSVIAYCCVMAQAAKRVFGGFPMAAISHVEIREGDWGSVVTQDYSYEQDAYQLVAMFDRDPSMVGPCTVHLNKLL